MGELSEADRIEVSDVALYIVAKAMQGEDWRPDMDRIYDEWGSQGAVWACISFAMALAQAAGVAQEDLGGEVSLLLLDAKGNAVDPDSTPNPGEVWAMRFVAAVLAKDGDGIYALFNSVASDRERAGDGVAALISKTAMVVTGYKRHRRDRQRAAPKPLPDEGLGGKWLKP